MEPFKLLDVSLRDGGHRTDFHFKQPDLNLMLTQLDKGGVDYIEIGYRNGSLHPINDIGAAGLCQKDYVAFCRAHIKKAKMAVMVHPTQVCTADIHELKENGVGLIRICVPRGAINQACIVIDRVKTAGLDVSVNFIHASQYEEHDMDAVVAQAILHHPDMIYFADSNGCLVPERVTRIYKKYTKRYPVAFGFHAHDNIGMAQANTIAAIDAGARFIDASLGGMGKGIGNLKTEFFIAYLQAQNIKRYDLNAILHAANYVRQTLGIGQEQVEMDEFVRGICDLSTAQVKSR